MAMEIIDIIAPENIRKPRVIDLRPRIIFITADPPNHYGMIGSRKGIKEEYRILENDRPQLP